MAVKADAVNHDGAKVEITQRSAEELTQPIDRKCDEATRDRTLGNSTPNLTRRKLVKHVGVAPGRDAAREKPARCAGRAGRDQRQTQNLGKGSSPPPIVRARGRRIAIRWPPSVTSLAVLPERQATRSGSRFPFGPQSATRSSSIIAHSTWRPVSTKSEKRSALAARSDESKGSGIWTEARGPRRASAFLTEFFMAVPFVWVWRPAAPLGGQQREPPLFHLVKSTASGTSPRGTGTGAAHRAGRRRSRRGRARGGGLHVNHAAGALRLACHGRGCEKYCCWWRPRSPRRADMVRWGKRLVARARRSVSAQGLITARTARAAPRSRATRRGGFEQPLLCVSARAGPRVAPDPGAGLLRTGDPSPLRDGSLSCLTGSRIQGSIPNHGDRRTRPPGFRLPAKG